MSVADQITRIKNNIEATYTAAQAKGATMPTTLNSENLPGCVGSIPTSGGTQFGLTAEQMLGTLDSEGNLTLSTLPSITFSGLKSIPANAYKYRFYTRTFEPNTTVSFPDLTSVGNSSMNNCFYNCGSLTTVDLSALTTVGDSGMYYCFYNCGSLTSVDLSALTNVDSSGMDSCFYGCTSLASVDLSALTNVDSSGVSRCFYNCTSLASVDLSALTTVGDSGMYYCFANCGSLASVDLSALTNVDSSGMDSCFFNCVALTSISFPSLTSVQTDSFGSASYSYAFRGCTALTEIHFRADMQATIEAMTGYADKWGATNASIMFDL